MADFVFNNAKGAIRTYAELGGGANDALIAVLVQSSGLETTLTLRDYDDLAALLAGTTNEATFTNYTRKTISASITVTVDDTNDRVDIDMPDLTWTSAGGGTDNALGGLIVCYDPDTTGGTDSSIVPVAFYDFSQATNGVDLTAEVGSSGFLRAA